MKSLYDVFGLEQRSTVRTFVMRAPLDTIAAVYGLHKQAENRVVRETMAGPAAVCTLYNGDRNFGRFERLEVEYACELGGSNEIC